VMDRPEMVRSTGQQMKQAEIADNMRKMEQVFRSRMQQLGRFEVPPGQNTGLWPYRSGSARPRQGARLDSLIEQNMCQMSQVLGRERTAYHPQARDIAEAVAHQTLQNRLRSVCDAG
jgi:hypothetical protein